jgi:hypothetical protein
MQFAVSGGHGRRRGKVTPPAEPQGKE